MLCHNEELEHEREDELQLARCWRDVSNGKLTEEEQIRVCFWRVSLASRRHTPQRENIGRYRDLRLHTVLFLKRNKANECAGGGTRS